MRLFKGLLLIFFLISVPVIGLYGYNWYEKRQHFYTPAATPPSAAELNKFKRELTDNETQPETAPATEENPAADETVDPDAKHQVEPVLGINTADVREDTSSVQFLNLFRSAIPFNETIPWGSSKEVEYDDNGWPTKLNGGKAGTKFLNRLPEGTVEDGFFTVLYDGEGEIFYGNDARLVVHRPGKDIIEIKAGKDKILNASLFIKKTDEKNYIRNIRILPEGGICEGAPHLRVKAAEECEDGSYRTFEEHHDKIVFNPDYIDFMKDFQVVRFMNMSGMTRNPEEKWAERNTLDKATWGGKYGSRGAPVEVMVELANVVRAHPWFSMPYKANDDYVRRFAEYVKEHLDPGLKAYIEYSNEVWNPIFIHHDYAIEQGLKAKLDKRKSPAGYKWYSKRSVEVFKIWEEVFGGKDPLVRVMGGWVSNQNMSSQILAYEDAYKHTDAIAIAPYVSAHPKELRKAKNVDDVFRAMMEKRSKWSMNTTINYINKQEKVARSFGVDLIAYEGGQHLVDWDTRRADDHPNPLLYAANRDPRMGIIYDELMREWKRAGGKLFVAFSAPRIYSWYGSWGIKEHIRQARSDAPKYDSLMRYLENNLHPEKPAAESAAESVLQEQEASIAARYVKTPYQIWDMSRATPVVSRQIDSNPNDLSVNWQANWDSKKLYLALAVMDEDLQKGDEVLLTLDPSIADQEEQTRIIPNGKAAGKGDDDSADASDTADSAENSPQTENKAEPEATARNAADLKEKPEKTTEDKNDDSSGSDAEDTKQTSSETNKNDIQSDKEGTEKKEKPVKKEKSTETKQEQVIKEIETELQTDKNKTESVKKKQEDVARTFIFTPFDKTGENNTVIRTDTGYLITTAIPWNELFDDKKKTATRGNRFGINLRITDVDDHEKGMRTLYLRDKNEPLPELELTYRMD